MRIQIFKNVSDFAGVEIFQVFFQRFVIILADNSDQKIADLFLSAVLLRSFSSFFFIRISSSDNLTHLTVKTQFEAGRFS